MVLLDACHSGGFWGNYSTFDTGDLEKVEKTALLASASETTKSHYNQTIDGQLIANGYPLISAALLEGFVRNETYLSMDTNRDNKLSIYEMGTWVENSPLKDLLDDEVVLEMEFGDPVVFKEDLWTPEYAATDDFDGEIGVEERATGPIALITLSAPEDGELLTCTNNGATNIVLDGTASIDPEGDPLTYTWTGPFGTLHGEVINVILPSGAHEITLTVEDSDGGIDIDIVEITVEEDTVAPSLEVFVSPDVLWPANHKMVPIRATVTTVDVCDANPAVSLLSITASEGDNVLGDGNTIDDIQEAVIGTDDRAFSLRAERSGKGGGRIYTVTYAATDASGNTATASATVTVPHNR
jgi:hypothetical protein